MQCIYYNLLVKDILHIQKLFPNTFWVIRFIIMEISICNTRFSNLMVFLSEHMSFMILIIFSLDMPNMLASFPVSILLHLFA